MKPKTWLCWWAPRSGPRTSRVSEVSRRKPAVPAASRGVGAGRPASRGAAAMGWPRARAPHPRALAAHQGPRCRPVERIYLHACRQLPGPAQRTRPPRARHSPPIVKNKVSTPLGPCGSARQRGQPERPEPRPGDGRGECRPPAHTRALPTDPQTRQRESGATARPVLYWGAQGTRAPGRPGRLTHIQTPGVAPPASARGPAGARSPVPGARPTRARVGAALSPARWGCRRRGSPRRPPAPRSP